MTIKTDLTFEEGPFFLIVATLYPHARKRVVIWATDETAARHVFAFRLQLPTAYYAISHIGDLDALKDALRLSPTQIADLHREGYLRL